MPSCKDPSCYACMLERAAWLAAFANEYNPERTPLPSVESLTESLRLLHEANPEILTRLAVNLDHQLGLYRQVLAVTRVVIEEAGHGSEVVS